MNDQAITPASATAQSVRLHPVDDRERPAWGMAPDGRMTKLDADDRFEAAWLEWLGDACQHPRKVVIGWVNAGGSMVYKRYCYDCGCCLSQAIAHRDAQAEGIHDIEIGKIQSISNHYSTQRDNVLKGILSASAERAQPGKRVEYDDYLRSPEWKRKASLIMQRANHRCEGCLSRPATQVHHLTYAHMHNEFAFELVALCAPCHQRIHQSEAA